jgi:hypothetical protein
MGWRVSWWDHEEESWAVHVEGLASRWDIRRHIRDLRADGFEDDVSILVEHITEDTQTTCDSTTPHQR